MRGAVLLSLFVLVATANGRAEAAPLPEIRFEAIKLAGKGRAQDRQYNEDPEIARLVEMGRGAVRHLIDKLVDETKLPDGNVDHWPDLRVGDLAFILLMDLFLDSDGRSPKVQGYGFDDFVEGPESDAAALRFRALVEKRGRKSIQEKWRRLWRESRDRLEWDERNRCFRVAGCRISAEEFDVLEDVLLSARVVEPFDSGLRIGPKVFSIRPGSRLAQLRVWNGDVLLTVAGHATQTREDLVTAMNAMRACGRVELHAVRERHDVRWSCEIH